MSEEKQIEEMARDIFAPKVAIDGIDIAFAAVHGADKPDSHFMRIAQHLYNAGYRKQGENVIELPCKVGTTLYFIYNSPYADKPDLTPRIYKTADWYFEVDKTGIVINTSDIHSFNKKYDYYLGETVFLTKEEAEEALAKMKGGE